MPTVTCYDCKKKYDYAEDGFCPRCGSFNQPRKGSYTVSANGDIVRADGINEASHSGSFVHAEYHTEERERKRLGLDKDVPKKEPGKPRHTMTVARKKTNPVGIVFLLFWLAALLLIIFSTVFSLI